MSPIGDTPDSEAPAQDALMADQTRKALERLSKVHAMLSDVMYAIADGEIEEAEELMDGLHNSEMFVTVAPCASGPYSKRGA